MQGNKMYDQNQSQVLNTFDFSALDEMDPSLSDGFKLAFDREVPFELRLQESREEAQEVGTLESIRVKILIQGDQRCPSMIKIELTSENDLFFHYTSTTDNAYFSQTKNEQQLNIKFENYLSTLTKVFINCQKEPHRYFAVFFLQTDGYARLDFIENMEYKFIELFSVDFMASTEEIIRQNITYRYNALKAKLLIYENRLKDLNALIKLKNPSLLMQLQNRNNKSINKIAQNQTNLNNTLNKSVLK